MFENIIGPCWCWVMNRNGDTNLCTCCQPSAKIAMQSWSQSKPHRQRWTNCPVILCVCCDISGCTLIPLLSTCLQRWPDAPDHLQAWQLFSSPGPTSKPSPPTVLSYDYLFSSPLLHIPHNHDQPDRHDYQNFLQQNVKKNNLTLSSSASSSEFVLVKGGPGKNASKVLLTNHFLPLEVAPAPLPCLHVIAAAIIFIVKNYRPMNKTAVYSAMGTKVNIDDIDVVLRTSCLLLHAHCTPLVKRKKKLISRRPSSQQYGRT